MGESPRGFESHPVRWSRKFGPEIATDMEYGAWLSPVERCVRVAEVPGSNPGAPMVIREAGPGEVARMRTAGSARGAGMVVEGPAGHAADFEDRGATPEASGRPDDSLRGGRKKGGGVPEMA